MEFLPLELFLEIAEHLEDKDKLNLLFSCKEFYYRRSLLRYHSMIKLRNVPANLIDNFTNVFLFDLKKIPKNVRKITFFKKLNQSLVGLIPETITHITFGYDFNKSLENSLPASLESLIFGNEYNQSLPTLPETLRHLQFGEKFNQLITELLPSRLEVLIFSKWFNQDLNHQLPESLLHLEFGTEFNRKIDYLPPKLIYLKFGWTFNQSLTLPLSLKHLVLGNHFKQTLNLTNHKYLQYLQLVNVASITRIQFPQSITHITFNWFTSGNLASLLPKTTTHLEIANYYPEHLTIPSSVTHLIMGNCERLKSCDLGCITNLIFKDDFNMELPCLLPASLTHLKFGRSFNQSIEGMFPASLTHLIFGNHFNQSLGDGVRRVTFLPPFLTHLEFGNEFNQRLGISELTFSFLPATLRYLKLGRSFTKSLEWVPDDIENIELHKRYKLDTSAYSEIIKFY